MCGRYALKTPKNILLAILGGVDDEEKLEIKPHYNIAPTFQVLVVRCSPDGKKRVLRKDFWGLVPYWAKNPTISAHTTNAKSETITDKASFKNAFKKRRCLIPIDGFYEWDRSVKPSQPYYFSMKDNKPFALAGLYEDWKVRWTEDDRDEEKKAAKPITFPITLGGVKYNQGDVLESCTIITTNANSLMAKVHDRMPVIIDPKNYDAWLDPKLEDPGILRGLLKPYPVDKMQSWPVDRKVGAVKNDTPDCIEPLSESE